jgi:repressor LexA
MKPFDESMLVKTKEYIEEYQRRRGIVPSLRKIMRDNEGFFGVSISKVQRYVLELNRRGQLNYDKNEGIRGSEKLLAGKTKPIPMVGECACGDPILAVENIIATYSLPEELFGPSDHFMLRAKGLSMIEKGINDGDIMVVRHQNTAEIGDIVIARLNGEEATAKIYSKENGKYLLKPANSSIHEDGSPEYSDIIPEGEWEILGVVDSVIHRFK